MTDTEMKQRIQKSRELIRWTQEEFESDQMLRRPQPPLVKAAVSDRRVALPRQFAALPLERDLVKIIFQRRSSRVYTQEAMDLLTLSFLLWSTQGVKEIRGNNYATLRTVPSGGARHPFETYLYIQNVTGLPAGLYHYLPMEHALEPLDGPDPGGEDIRQALTDALCGQAWALKANAIFFYSVVPYRAEWRYAFDAHRVMMMDAGHVTENLYLACSALHLGTCAIAAVDTPAGSALFGLDGQEEYIFYAAPVGTISAKNEAEEQSFYAFLNDGQA